jgi:hypothetical protein
MPDSQHVLPNRRSGLGRLIPGGVTESMRRGATTSICTVRALGHPVERPTEAWRQGDRPSSGARSRVHEAPGVVSPGV